MVFHGSVEPKATIVINIIMKNTRKISYGAIALATMVILGAAMLIMPSVSSAAYYYGTTYQRPYYQPVQTVYQPIYQPVYQPAPIVYYQPIQASCYPVTPTAYIGNAVTWTTSISGGNGSYYVSWSGSDGLSGSGTSIAMAYYQPGYQTASITVMSAGQTISMGCSGSVNVIGNSYYYNQPYYSNNTYYTQQPAVYSSNTYYTQSTGYPQTTSSNASGLNIGCYADPTTATINQPVTWNVEVTGGQAPYTYSWTGTDGLSGSQSSIIKYYGTSGSKSAVVAVTSADGRNATWACSNEVTVRSASSGTYTRPVQTVHQAPAPQQQAPNTAPLSAASSLSLQGVPWGWVAILVILVLFFTVLYLLFNRPKI